jgi:hypothetical protein
MEPEMPTEKIAALAWRFIGVAIFVAALPGLLLSLQPFIWLLANLGFGVPSFATFLPVFLFLAQMIVGLLVLRFSRRLAKVIARGL